MVTQGQGILGGGTILVGLQAHVPRQWPGRTDVCLYHGREAIVCVHVRSKRRGHHAAGWLWQPKVHGRAQRVL